MSVVFNVIMGELIVARVRARARLVHYSDVFPKGVGEGIVNYSHSSIVRKSSRNRMHTRLL